MCCCATAEASHSTGQRGYHCAPVLDHLKDGKRYCDLLTASLAPLVSSAAPKLPVQRHCVSNPGKPAQQESFWPLIGSYGLAWSGCPAPCTLLAGRAGSGAGAEQVQKAVKDDPGQLLSVRTAEQAAELALMDLPLELGVQPGAGPPRAPFTAPFTQMVPQLWQLTRRCALLSALQSVPA